MEFNFNLGSLKTLQGPIVDYLKQSKINVENNIRLYEDKKVPIEHDAIFLLSKVQKSFNMIGLLGLSKVLNLTEYALDCVREIKFDSTKSVKILEISKEIIDNVIIYIDKLIGGEPENSIKFFELYQYLATLLNKEFKIEDLFYPKLDFKNMDTPSLKKMKEDITAGIYISANNKATLLNHLEKIESNLKNRVLNISSVIEEQNFNFNQEAKNAYQSVCRQVFDAADYIQKLRINKSTYILYGIYKFYICALSPVFNIAFSEYVKINKTKIINNLNYMLKNTSQIIKEIEKFEEGDKTSYIRVEDELVKSIILETLFLIKLNPSLKEMPVFKELSVYFDFDIYIQQLSDTKLEFNMIAKNPAILEEIEKTFNELKNDFNNIDSKKVTEQSFLQHVVKMTNGFVKLNNLTKNHKEIAPIGQIIQQVFHKMGQKNINWSKGLEKELSFGFVILDFAIENLIKSHLAQDDLNEFLNQSNKCIVRIKSVMDGVDNLSSNDLPTFQHIKVDSFYKKTIQTIFEYLDKDVKEVEDAINLFLNDDGEIEDISNIFIPLNNIKGIFQITGRKLIANLLYDCINLWKEVQLNGKNEQNIKTIKESLGLIGSISLLINDLKNANEEESEITYQNIIKKYEKVQQAGQDIADIDYVISEDAQDLFEVVQPIEIPQNELNQTIDETKNLLEDFEVKTLENKVSTNIIDSSFHEEMDSVKQVFIDEYQNHIDTEMYDIYTQEIQEVIQNIEQMMLQFTPDHESLTTMKRYFHTIKGSSRMVELKFIGEIGWMVEQTLAKVMTGEIIFDQKLFDSILFSKNLIKESLIELNKLSRTSIDLTTVKELFLFINPHLITQIEIHVKENKNDFIENTFTLTNQVQESIKEDKSNELVLQFNFEEDTAPTVQATPQVETTTSEFEFNFEEEPAPTVQAAPQVETATSEFEFNFEEDTAPTLQAAPQVETTSSEFEFNFEEDTAPTVQATPQVETATSEFEFNFEEDTAPNVQVTPQVETATSEFEFNFEEDTAPTVQVTPQVETTSSEFEFNFEEEQAPTVQATPQVEKATSEFEFNFEEEPSIDVNQKKLEVHFEESPVQAINQEDEFNMIINSLEINEEESTKEQQEPVFVSNMNQFQNFIDEKEKDEEQKLNKILDEEIRQNISSLMEYVYTSTITEEQFMRFAHNLKGLSANKNATVLHDICEYLEKISLILLENSIELDAKQLDTVQDVLSNLEEFLSMDKDSAVYSLYINKLDNILNSFYAQENVEDEVSDNFVDNELDISSHEVDANEDLIELSSEAPLDVKDFSVIVQHLNQLKDYQIKSINQMQKTLSDSLGEGLAEKLEEKLGQSQNDLNQMMKSSLSSLQKSMDSKHDSLLKSLEAENSAYKKQANIMLDKINQLEKSLQELKTQQQTLEEKQKQGIDGVKKDIRILANILKKKSEEPFSEDYGYIQKISDCFNDWKIQKIDILKGKENFIQYIDYMLSVCEKKYDEIQLVVPQEISFALDVPIEPQSPVKPVKEIVLEFAFIFEQKINDIVDDIEVELLEISQEEINEMFQKSIDIINSNKLNQQSKEFKRYLHTLKGSARMTGMNRIGMICHQLETLLESIELKKYDLQEFIDLFKFEMEKVSILKDDFTNYADFINQNFFEQFNAPQDHQEEIVLKQQENILSQEVLEPQTNILSVVDLKDDAQKIVKKEYSNIRISSDLVDSLINDAGDIRLNRSSLEGFIDKNRLSVNELKDYTEKLTFMIKELEIQAETQIQNKKNLLKTDENFDPLEMDRFTRLQELTRFIGEAISDITDTVSEIEKNVKLEENIVTSQIVSTNNMLDSLMKIRLVHFETISERLYKIVRNTNKELGKKTKLQLMGEKNEIDRVLLDKIIIPIEHILRNSIAHGIEQENIRVSKGKSAVGQITINLELDGNFILISIKDDGAGINIKKVREIGIKKGLIEENTLYPDEKIISLIFNSGFSTSDTISQVAGRGVGMDIVKNEINSLGGLVNVFTQPDRGTEFVLKVPVSISTNQAILCHYKNKLLAIPAVFVEQIISFKNQDIKKAYELGYSEKFNNTPIYHISSLLGYTNAQDMPELRTYNPVILVKYGDKQVLVHVDKVETTSEIVIKSVGPFFAKKQGILGATLLGDSRQGFVINPVLLAQSIRMQQMNVYSQKKKVENKKVIMIVDDSLTVRKATSKILERYNYSLILAKDGEDALQQIQIMQPDLILSDIEIPRMDGFELVRNLKSNILYKNIPIIMITSRTADKHQSLAFSLGVQHFLGKPYQEKELLSVIKELIHHE